MKTINYLTQSKSWPEAGRHILAQFDETSVTVYQAYRAAIANYAVVHQAFGGEFSYTRMSWIKPNFLWMMYRSGWAQKEGQERILAVRLRRSFFDELLKNAVASSFNPGIHTDIDDWKSAMADSEVRLQWDPDHDPSGAPVTRRAVQIGLRGRTLERYGIQEILSIEDITPFVIEQRHHLEINFATLMIPQEDVYTPSDIVAIKNAEIDMGY